MRSLSRSWVGSAGRTIDFFIATTESIWSGLIAIVVIGPISGVDLPNYRTHADFGIDAVRSQYATLLLTVALASPGLVIVSG
jgi:hypothetical protein